MMDEALLAFRGWGLFALKHPFLIGGISSLGFHLPPYFYYFSAFFLPLTDFNPLVWGWLTAVFGVMTVFALFCLAKEFHNTRMGLVTSLVYGVSFTAVFFDRHWWPLSLNPLFTILVVFLLVKKNLYWRWFWLGLLLAFAITADPSNLVLLLLTGYSLWEEREIFGKGLVFVLIFGALFLTPLIFFDLRHQGSNVQGILQFFEKKGEVSLDPKSFLAAFLLPTRSLSRFWYSPQKEVSFFHTYCSPVAFIRQFGQPVFLQFLALVLLTVYYFGKKRAGKSGEIYFARLLMIYLLGLLVYGGLLGKPIYEHYLAGLLPVFAVITAKVFVRFWAIGFFLLIFFVFSNIGLVFKARNAYGLASTKEAVNWTIEKLKDRDFALDVKSKCFRYNGLRYLFEIKESPPAISFIDPDFFWLYREKPAEVFPKIVVLFVDNWSHKDYQPVLPIIDKKDFEGWRVYILDNSSKAYEIEF